MRISEAHVCVCVCGGGRDWSTSHSGVECSPKVAIHWRGSSIEEDGSTEEVAPSEWRGVGGGGGGGGRGRSYPQTYTIYRGALASIKSGKISIGSLFSILAAQPRASIRGVNST